jgi:hypothetical protein
VEGPGEVVLVGVLALAGPGEVVLRGVLAFVALGFVLDVLVALGFVLDVLVELRDDIANCLLYCSESKVLGKKPKLSEICCWDSLSVIGLTIEFG